MSHYEVLGLPPSASAAAVRKAYRQRAKHEHPDKGGSDEQFQRLQQAYEVLADAGSRQQYDRTVLQQRESLRRQAAARKQEEERLAKQAAERARFVVQQRQRMMEQEKAEAALRRVDGWAAQPSTVLGGQSPASRGRQRGGGAGRARSAGAARQPAASGRADGRGETGNSRRYVGPTAHERSRYGYDQAQARPSSMGGVYAGVTGMDSSTQGAPAGPQEAVLFGSTEGRYYHRRHDCHELQLSSNVRTGTAYHFTVMEHKSRCPLCCGTTAPPEAPAPGASGASAQGTTGGGGYSGPTPEEAQQYLRREAARKQEEERQAKARAAAERARYVGPTAQERAWYGYTDPPARGSPAARAKGATSGVERVVHGMGNIHATLYGGKGGPGSPARATAHPHPLAGLGGAAASPSAVRPPPQQPTGSPVVGGSARGFGSGPELDEMMRRAQVAGFTFV